MCCWCNNLSNYVGVSKQEARPSSTGNWCSSLTRFSGAWIFVSHTAPGGSDVMLRTAVATSVVQRSQRTWMRELLSYDNSHSPKDTDSFIRYRRTTAQRVHQLPVVFSIFPWSFALADSQWLFNISRLNVLISDKRRNPSSERPSERIRLIPEL